VRCIDDVLQVPTVDDMPGLVCWSYRSNRGVNPVREIVDMKLSGRAKMIVGAAVVVAGLSGGGLAVAATTTSSVTVSPAPGNPVPQHVVPGTATAVGGVTIAGSSGVTGEK
jgi:hypothetical protein